MALLPKLKTWQWPLPLMIVALILIGIAGKHAWQLPYDGLDWSSTSGDILSVIAEGPAARAGFQVGDTIVAVDGVRLREIAALYADKRAGDQVVFTLLRQGRLQQAQITLSIAPLSRSISQTTSVFIALGLWLIGTTVLALRPASREARLFFIINQLGSGALTTGTLSIADAQLASNLFHLCLCWLAPLIVHFHATFPVRWPGAQRGLTLKLFYSLAVVLSLPYAITSLPRLKSLPAYPLLYTSVRIFFALALLTATALLLHNYRSTPAQAATRPRIRLCLFGTSLALMPLITLSVLPAALGGTSLIPYPVAFSFFLLSPLAYGYAIYRYNLFETDRILNRTVVYSIVGLLWAGLYLALVVPLNWLAPAAAALNPLVGALLVLLMVIILPPLQKGIQKWVDGLFYGEWYDYEAAVVRFSQALSVTLDESALAELLVEQLPTMLRVRTAMLLLRGEKGVTRLCCLSPADPRVCRMPAKCLGCRASAQKIVPEVAKGSALEQLLRRERISLEVERLRRMVGQAEISAGEAELLSHPELRLWQPLVFQGELEGVLLLGPKMADDVYSSADYHILETLAWQAAATARNGRLVRELRQRLNEIADSKRRLQEAHRQLLVGREQERMRLAREIHEGPVQELIGISYQLRDGVRASQGTPLAETLQALRAESLRMVDDLRHLCANLRPPALDVLGLAVAIRTHVAEEIRLGPAITLDLQDQQGALSQDTAISLFRIYQEAVTNAIRHAEANHVAVQLEMGSAMCTLSIRDDGHGFVRPARLEELVQQKHFGLAGMQERAEALGGRLEVKAAPGAGTEIKVWVPLSK